MLYTKNRLFMKYGHDCDITYHSDDFSMFIPSPYLKTRIIRKIRRIRMASELNRRAHLYLRSQSAIATEHYQHLKFLYMIHPFSDLRTAWEAIMTIIYLLQFLIIPLDVITFQHIEVRKFEQSTVMIICRLILDICCIADIVMNFITGYYDFRLKMVVLEPKRVARHYLTRYFVIDIVSSLPVHISRMFHDFDDSHKLVKFFYYSALAKLTRILTFKSYCRNFAEIVGLGYASLNIFMTTTIIILIYHWVCCVLIFTFSMFFFSDDVMIYTIVGYDTKILITTGYFDTLYQTSLIMCTAGHAHLNLNNSMKILIIIMWITTKILYIYMVSAIMNIVMAHSSAAHKYEEMVRQLQEYMRHKQMPEYMQKRLVSYYQFRFQKSYFRENEIMATLSGALRQEIIMYSCRKLVENVAFFKNLPLTLLVKIVSCLKSEVFLVNDVIVRANTYGDSMYFISSGTVAVYTRSGKEVCHLEDGAHFGEIALVMKDEMRIASVVAVEVSELYRLDRKDFIRAIYPYPDLLNNVQYIAADRLERTTILDEHHRREIGSKRIIS